MNLIAILKEPPRILLCLLCLLPWLMLGLCFLFFSPDMPYLDQWELAPLLVKMKLSTLSVQDLFAQHNEHRIFFPRILMLFLAHCTQWNIYAELALNFVLGSLLYLQAALIFRRFECAYSASYSAWLYPLMAVLIFSLSQWQNWFLGWQLQIFLSLCAVTGAIQLLNRPEWGRLGVCGAVLLGWCATYSFANGMLIWPIGLVLFVGNRIRKEAIPAPYIVAWILNGVAAISLYLYGFATPGYHPPLSAALHQPLQVLLYWCTYLGQPLVNYSTLGAAMAGGIGVLCWAVLSWRYLRTAQGSTWCWGIPFGLGLYALGSAGMTALARSELGMEQALSSRYISIANLLWLALMLWTFGAFTVKTRRTVFGRSVIYLVLGLLLGIASCYGAYRWTERCHAYRAGRSALLHGDDADILRIYYPDTEKLIERRTLLREYGFSIFREE